MLNILMNGCNGKMGQSITKLCKEVPSFNIIAGITRQPDKIQNNYPVFTSFESVKILPDIVMDFSNPVMLPGVVTYCLENKKPLVTGTTDLTNSDFVLLKEAANSIPVFFSANMSIGVSVLTDLAVSAASILHDSFDIEIIEKHHREKKDAPSGTALMLANEINRCLDDPKTFIYDRTTIKDKRKTNELGISSIRGGTIAGEHTVIFAGHDEIIEIKHTSLSREVFAQGALKAAQYIIIREKGFYDMKTMLKELI